MTGCYHVGVGRLRWTGLDFSGKRITYTICAACGMQLTKAEPAEGTP